MSTAVQETGGTGSYGVTLDNQSVASDDNSDFVVTWARYDPLLSSNGTPVADAKGVPIIEGNIYARYYTNEVQRITLPSGTSSFKLDYNTSEEQELSLTSTLEPFPTLTGIPLDITGTFKLGFDLNGDGAIESNEQVTASYDELTALYGPVTFASSLTSQLQTLGGPLADCSVTAVNAHNFMINFGPAEAGVKEPLIVADTTSYNFSGGYLPAVTITGTQIPGTTVAIPVVAEQSAVYGDQHPAGVYPGSDEQRRRGAGSLWRARAGSHSECRVRDGDPR